jgi:hypothetical protein
MKKIPWQTVLLMLWPYVALGLNVFLIRFGLLVWLFGGLLTLLLLAVNIRCAWRMKDAAHLSVLAMCVKITHIGAYAASAFLCVGLFAAIPLVLGILLTNVCMLAASSAYGLCGLLLAWREKRLTDGWAIVLAISQCIFVLDVPGSLLICHRVKKEDSHAERTPS